VRACVALFCQIDTTALLTPRIVFSKKIPKKYRFSHEKTDSEKELELRSAPHLRQ